MALATHLIYNSARLHWVLAYAQATAFSTSIFTMHTSNTSGISETHDASFILTCRCCAWPIPLDYSDLKLYLVLVSRASLIRPKTASIIHVNAIWNAHVSYFGPFFFCAVSTKKSNVVLTREIECTKQNTIPRGSSEQKWHCSCS